MTTPPLDQAPAAAAFSAPVPVGSSYQKFYSKPNFWAKIRKYAKVAGRDIIEKTLTLYYVLQDPAVPIKAKAIICGALGYFILPFDVIPDVMAGVGYSDDIAVIVAALAAVSAHVTPEIAEKAERKAGEWVTTEG